MQPYQGTQLRPLYEDAVVRTGRGRFSVQLEIPPGSTITPFEADKLLALATWDVDPNDWAAAYEGGRSLLIPSEKSRPKGKFTFNGIQLSGIGYRPLVFQGQFFNDDGRERMRHPTTSNFMDTLPSNTTLMSTPQVSGGNMTIMRRQYRACGTYTHSELVQKVQNTLRAARFNLQTMVVPEVLAYGRYLDQELANQEGQFGFIALPIPHPNKPRALADILKSFRAKPSTISDPMEAMEEYYQLIWKKAKPLIFGLREMHDQIRCAHFQPHFSNFYEGGGMACMMDWSTLRPLGDDRQENLICRAIDIGRPMVDISNIFFSGFPLRDPTARAVLTARFYTMVMNIYSLEKPETLRTFQRVNDGLSRALGRPPLDWEVIVSWLKEKGFEQ